MSRIFDLIAQNSQVILINEEDELECVLSQISFLHLEPYPRSVVFAYLDNSFHSVVTYLSLMKSAHVVALLPLNLSIRLKEAMEERYQPNLIFDKSRTHINYYTFTQTEEHSGYFVKQTLSTDPIHPELKVLMSTSGTTGSPKFVKITEQNLIANAQSILAYLPINADDITPLNLPIYYSYGLSVLNTNLIKGGKIFCSNLDLMHPKFWQSFTKWGFTSFAGVPVVYEMLDRIGFTKKEYPSLKYFTQAGGKLKNELVAKYATYALGHSVQFFVMYGATEATARISFLPPSRIHEKIGSIGIPIQDGVLRLDPITKELCYSGPNVFGGYSNDAEDLAAIENQPWLKTGDIGSVDEDGFYYIIGRLKRIIKLFGARINLDEVEQILYKKYNTVFYALGVEDKSMLIMYTNLNIENDKIKSYLSKELKIHPSVLTFKLIEKVPLNHNSKVDYQQLKALYAN